MQWALLKWRISLDFTGFVIGNGISKPVAPPPEMGSTRVWTGFRPRCRRENKRNTLFSYRCTFAILPFWAASTLVSGWYFSDHLIRLFNSLRLLPKHLSESQPVPNILPRTSNLLAESPTVDYSWRSKQESYEPVSQSKKPEVTAPE